MTTFSTTTIDNSTTWWHYRARVRLPGNAVHFSILKYADCN